MQPLIDAWWPRRRRRRSPLIANRPQVYRRSVDLIIYTALSAHIYLSPRVLGKAPRKQLATKAARKTAVVSVARSRFPVFGNAAS